MSDGLKYGRKAAQSGKARSLVVFVHGYGADGADLLGLGDALASHLPDTAFVAPDAPQPCVGNPFGYQWFPIPWLDGSTEEAARSAMAESVRLFNAFLDARLAEEGLGPDALALVGFSQGAMMSLHVAPRRAQAVAAVVAISGRLLVPDLLAADKALAEAIKPLHGYAAFLLLALVAAHIGAAIKHQFIDRDGLISRMLPSKE